MLNYARGAYFNDGFYNWSDSRIGIIDGKMVTHWGIFNYKMRIGRARVNVAGIGAVMTDEAYRKRGLMEETAQASLSTLAQAGYDMTLLFGAKNYYDRFGYVRAWAEPKYIVEVNDIPSDEKPLKVRKFSPPGPKELSSLYNRRSAKLTGTAVRPTWSKNPNSGVWIGHYWVGENGKAAGYVVTQMEDGLLRHIDSAGDSQQILSQLRRLAIKSGVEKIDFFNLHNESQLAKALRRGNCQFETKYFTSARAMIRTVNLESTLVKMKSELSARLADSKLAGWRGDLLISDLREKVVLSINRSNIEVKKTPAKKTVKTKHAIRGGAEIAQLLIGTQEPVETVVAGKIRLSGDGKALTNVLFSNQHPDIGGWDYF